MGADTVKIFCPKCSCVYHPPPIRSRSSHHGGAGVDGAAFGTTFPHLFLMTFSNLVPDRLPRDSAYVPRVFGFRVHISARQRTTGSSSGLLAGSGARSNGSRRQLGFVRKSSSTKADTTTQAAKAETKEEEGKKSKSTKRRSSDAETGGRKSDGNGDSNAPKRRRNESV